MVAFCISRGWSIQKIDAHPLRKLAEACGSLRKPAEACGLRQLTRKLKDYAERQFGDVELTKQVPGSSSISAKVARWVPDAAGSSISPGPRHPAILAISATVFLGFGG